MALHLIFSPQGLVQALARQHPNDPFLLLGDGVLSLQKLLHDRPEAKIYVVAQDAAARGITLAALETSISAIDYAEFVDLTTQHSPIVSWKN